MSDTEIAFDSDQDVSESHSKLIESVAQLDKGQRVKKPQRNEPTLEVSEFHLVKSGISDKDAVRVQDLANSLGKKGHHATLTKSLQSTRQKVRLLSKPLEKPAAERIKRVIGFESSKKELGKWNAIISSNRTASTMKFPIIQSSLKMEPSKEFVKRFRLQSDLEKKLAELEPPQKENLEENKNENKYAMTLKEAIERRKEVAKIRAQQSYREAKAYRQKKIKSKKYHRVQRKQKIKLQLKEFETLQKTDPEAALEKLEQLDKARAEERMTLRHKSTGQWAKNKQIRAKYDKDTRQELGQQLAISRELTQKIKKGSDTDNEEEEEESATRQLSTNDKENPWVNNTKTESEIDEFIKSYRKYWDETGKNVDEKLKAIKDANEISKEMQSQSSINELTKSAFQTTIAKSNSESITTQVQSTDDDITSQTESRKSQGVTETEKSNADVTKPQQKVTESEPRNKSKKNKSCKKNKVSSTTVWNVDTLEVPDQKSDPKCGSKSKQVDIDEMFDRVEEKMKNRIELKLQRVKDKYETTAKPERQSNKNKFRKNDDDCFEGLELKDTKQRPVVEGPLDETACKDKHNTNGSSQLQDLVNARLTSSSTIIPNLEANRSQIEIDPNKYINAKPKHLRTMLPDAVTQELDAMDDSEDDEEKHKIISEAFADDDVVEEFKKEKEEEVKKRQPKNIDLTLPGWGTWGGKNIKIPKRKKRRFILKFPKEAPHRDENKGDVILYEDNKQQLREHQVSDLPYPFTSVQDFEASIRMPIGRNFVPEKAHKKLIEPKIKTKMGEIIEPMDDSVLVDPKRKNKLQLPLKRNNLGPTKNAKKKKTK